MCPGCGSWDSFSREHAEGDTSGGAVALADIAPEPDVRRPTNIPAIDAILGGGFVPGSSLLLVGSPGAGKSTLALQILKKMNVRSLYVTGEESVGQLKMRAERLRIRSKRLFILFETNVRSIRREIAASGAEICVVDSIQTMFSETSDALPGSRMFDSYHRQHGAEVGGAHTPSTRRPRCPPTSTHC